MAATRNYDLLLQQLKSFIPETRIYTDELRTLGWGTDASFYRMIPRIVVRSKGEEEVSRIVKTCYDNHIPFTFRAAVASTRYSNLTDVFSHLILLPSIVRW